jgi:hypothetical protein
MKFEPLGIDIEQVISFAWQRFWKLVLHSVLKQTVRKYKFCGASLALYKPNDESAMEDIIGEEDSNTDSWFYSLSQIADLVFLSMNNIATLTAIQPFHSYVLIYLIARDSAKLGGRETVIITSRIGVIQSKDR